MNTDNTYFQRYSRHFSLAEVGTEGQKKLDQAKVLCVGAGGLGSAALLYLAAAGVGEIGIVEHDRVELSNLQRQILYKTHQIGAAKVDVTRDALLNLNPAIEVNCHSYYLTPENITETISDYDVVLDCTDNFNSRYLINDACVRANKPNIYASIQGFEGQCSIFGIKKSPCYRCIFPTQPPSSLSPSCTAAGVIGALPGILGSIQAMEAIKLILQKGTSLAGRLLTIDALTMQFREVTLFQNSNCEICYPLAVPPTVNASTFKVG